MTEENKSSETESETNIEQAAIDETIPPKRRRGRPSKAEKLQEQNPGESGSAAKEKRQYQKKKGNYDTDSVEKLARHIVGIHSMASKITRIPELEMSEIEGAMLADSIVNVAREYDLSLSGKTGAMIQLIGVAAMIYYPRFDSINERSKQRNEKVINP